MLRARETQADGAPVRVTEGRRTWVAARDMTELHIFVDSIQTGRLTCRQNRN